MSSSEALEIGGEEAPDEPLGAVSPFERLYIDNQSKEPRTEGSSSVRRSSKGLQAVSRPLAFQFTARKVVGLQAPKRPHYVHI